MANARIPCIKFHNISWTVASDVPPAVLELVSHSGPISLVGGSPETYYIPGIAVLFTPDFYHNDSQATDTRPAPNLFSGSKNIGLQFGHGSAETLHPFGNIVQNTSTGTLSKSFISSIIASEYLIGNISFTAGVTTSPVSTYITPRVIEGQTPLDEVVFESNPWVDEALWLLPDLMTIIAVMNSL